MSQKPRIQLSALPELGRWICHRKGVIAFGRTPKEAYARWEIAGLPGVGQYYPITAP